MISSRSILSRFKSRSSLSCSGAHTQIITSQSYLSGLARSTAASSTAISKPLSCACNIRLRASSVIAGWVMSLSACAPSLSAKARLASRRRSRVLSAFIISPPKRSASFSSTGEPGSVTCLASKSQSIMHAPASFKRIATLLLPAPV